MLRRTDEKSRWREATKIFVLICRKIGYVFISNFNRILTFTEFFFILCRRTEHIVFFECMKSNIKSRINISNIEKNKALHFLQNRERSISPRQAYTAYLRREAENFSFVKTEMRWCFLLLHVVFVPCRDWAHLRFHPVRWARTLFTLLFNLVQDCTSFFYSV